MRATDSMDGIDHCSSNNSPPCHLPTITVPTLIAAMGGHYFIRDNEIHYELSGAKDKEFVVIEGAEHGQTPCKACESFPGQYGNSVKNHHDYVRNWINKRFRAQQQKFIFIGCRAFKSGPKIVLDLGFRSPSN